MKNLFLFLFVLLYALAVGLFCGVMKVIRERNENSNA
jgi:hypothetical protein